MRKEMDDKRELQIGISKYARNNTIEHLKKAFTEDMLEQDVFEKRLEIAINTQDKTDLERIVEDLPEIENIQRPQSKDVSIPESESRIVNVLGEVKRQGVWKPPKDMKVKTTLGETSLDFTKAILSDGITDIEIKCVLGEVTIIVPEGVEVDGHCKVILGSFNDKSKNCENPDAPVLRIRGYTCLGSIEVRPPKVRILKRILKKFGLDLDH
ncbi:MAG: DUF1707 domain-containing protein [Spirochaetales bacterium]|nr:DUF1707 domain-containing protein [Spirochaetales bacterium]